MNWDRFVWNATGAMYYAVLIAWEYMKMGLVWTVKKIKKAVQSANKHHQNNKKTILV